MYDIFVNRVQYLLHMFVDTYIRHETDKSLIVFHYKMKVLIASSVKVNDSVYTVLYYNMYLLIMENYKHTRVQKWNNEPLCTHTPAST